MSNTLHLTPQLQKSFSTAIADGCVIRDVCRALGVSKSTYYNWLARGRAGEARYVDFLDAITRAKAKANMQAVKALRSALKPQKTVVVLEETYSETRIGKNGEPYEYKRTTMRKQVQTAPPDWRAATDFLKRRDPKNWSEKQRVDVTTNGETLNTPTVFLPAVASEDDDDHQ